MKVNASPVSIVVAFVLLLGLFVLLDRTISSGTSQQDGMEMGNPNCEPVYDFIHKQKKLGSSVRVFGKRELIKYQSRLPKDYCTEENIRAQAVEPWMSPADLAQFHHFLKDQSQKNSECMTYLEWGSGGSTFVALQYAHRVISIENYAEWCGIILQSSIVLCNIMAGKLVFVCVDAGPVGAMGTPKDMNNYNASLYIDVMDNFRKDFKADFVLIDGRFRVATALRSIRSSKPSSTLMFHDYKKWSDYWIVDTFFDRLPPPPGTNSSVFGAFTKKPKMDLLNLDKQQKIFNQRSH